MADRSAPSHAPQATEPTLIYNAASIPVWDLALRVFHWFLALLVLAAVATVKIGGDAMVWHGQIGRLILALLVARFAWGIVGGRYARFLSFPLGPTAIVAYLRGRWQGIGHNPLGAWSVAAMLCLLLGFAVSGPFIGDDAAYFGPLFRVVDSARSDALQAWHQSLEWPLYVLLGLHIAAIWFYQRRGHNLIGPMRHGHISAKKAPQPVTDSAGDLIGVRPWALFLALFLGLAAWWWSAGSWLPEPTPPPAAFDW